MSSQVRNSKHLEKALPTKSSSHSAEAPAHVDPSANTAISDDSSADLWGSCIVFALVQFM